MFHFDGANWAPGFHDPNNMPITGIYESPSGKVFVAGSSLFECDSQCVTNTNYAVASGYASTGCQVFDVCGNGETVYATGTTNDGSSGCLLTYGGGTWSSLDLTTLVGGAGACAVAPNGTVYVGGGGAIVSYTALNGATPATINWPAGTGTNNVYVTFQGIWTDGTNTFAAGGNRRIFSLTASGWNLVLNDSPITTSDEDNGGPNPSFIAVAGAGGEAWAFGADADSQPQAAFFNGSVWSVWPSALAPGALIEAAWAADSADYYAVGTASDELSALILKGHH